MNFKLKLDDISTTACLILTVMILLLFPVVKVQNHKKGTYLQLYEEYNKNVDIVKFLNPEDINNISPIDDVNKTIEYMILTDYNISKNSFKDNDIKINIIDTKDNNLIKDRKIFILAENTNTYNKYENLAIHIERLRFGKSITAMLSNHKKELEEEYKEYIDFKITLDDIISLSLLILISNTIFIIAYSLIDNHKENNKERTFSNEI